jgi:glucose/arabinose dehydrogenase
MFPPFFEARLATLFILTALLIMAGCGGSSSSPGQSPRPTPTPGPSPTPTPGPTPTPTPSPASVTLSPFVSGLQSPVDLQIADDGSGRMFVVEQGGTIRIISAGTLAGQPFLDISSKVNFDRAEQGLLGVAFHPNFAHSARFYVNYDRLSSGQKQTVIAEYQVGSNPDQSDPASERILLTINQPFSNHKAGQLAFGADGFLYFGLGDGGSGGDPQGNGQSTQTLLGKMLRIDVDRTSTSLPYAIPADNPFVSGGGLPEIWAFGFRNPWRFSFDRPSGRLFVADVGQDSFEEIDIVTKGGNYGWNIMEGTHCFNSATCNMSGLKFPVTEYDHTQGIAVIGGYVYHGAAIAGLVGKYVFGDFGSGTLWTLTESPPGTWTRDELLSTTHSISSFGQDAAGELYLVDLGGAIFKLSP